MKKILFLFTFSLPFALLSHAQNLPIQDTSKVVSVKKKVLEDYVGNYAFKDIGVIVEFLIKGDKLMAAVPGTGQFELIPGSKTAFRVKELGAQLEFSKGGKGPVKLYQSGRVFDGSKIEGEDTVNYTKVLPGDPSFDYDKLFTPFSAEWDLIIRDKKIGTATTILRHTVFNGEAAYRTGSVIRYESMDNVPFDDIGIFSKKNFAKLWARNAISQKDEVTSTMNGNEITQEYLNIKTGKVENIKKVTFDDTPIGAGVYLFLASDIQEGVAMEFPVAQIANSAWAKAQITGKESIHIESLDKTYDAWKVEYASGTVHWIIDEAPYMVKWKMPTGMVWKLTNYGN